VQVANPPTASEFHGGIIGVTLRPVSGADIVSLTTDEHLLHGSEGSSVDTTVQVVPGNEAPCRGSFSPKTRAVYLGSSLESDSGIVQIATAGSRRPLVLRGHYCASSKPTNCQ